MTHKAGQAASLMQSQGADLLSGQQWRFVDGFQMFGLWTESKFAKKLGDGDINFQAYMILIIRNKLRLIIMTFFRNFCQHHLTG